MACRRSCHWFNMPNIHFMCNMCGTMSKWTRDFIVATRTSSTAHTHKYTYQMYLITTERMREDQLSEGVNVKRCEQTKWFHLRLLLNYFSGSRLL